MQVKPWLENNKIFFETVAAILLSIMALVVSCTQSIIANKQLILSQSPRILIEPFEDVKGSIGEFKLFVKNLSFTELDDIRIYEDYFVTETQEEGQVGLIKIGAFSTKPNSIISCLKSNKRESITVNFKSIIEKMNDFYHERNGVQMRIARLKIKYRRKLDGKEFVQTRAYIIAGHGDFLFDYDERGMRTGLIPSFGDIKNVLGIDN